jgi:hypothetical protein
LMVQLNNYAAIRSAYGIDVPGPDADTQAVGEYRATIKQGYGRITSPLGFGPIMDPTNVNLAIEYYAGESSAYVVAGVDGVPQGPGSLLQFEYQIEFIGGMLSGLATASSPFNPGFAPPSSRPALGFDARDIDAAVFAGSDGALGDPFAHFEAVIAPGIDREHALQLLSECADCLEHDIGSHLSVEFLTWGEDAQVSLSGGFAMPLHDTFGRGGRLLLGDGFAARSLTTDAMHSVIDAKFNGNNLGDDPDYVLAARSAEQLGAASLAMSDRSYSLTDMRSYHDVYLDLEYVKQFISEEDALGYLAAREEIVSVLESFQTDYPIPRTRLTATGLGVTAGIPYVLLILVLDDETSARQARESLSGRAIHLVDVDPNLKNPIDSGVVGRVAWVKLNVFQDQSVAPFVLQPIADGQPNLETDPIPTLAELSDLLGFFFTTE